MVHTVLFVDDDPNVIAGLSRALHGECYQILGAASAPEALQILQVKSVDVIVSDEKMPGMSGLTLLKKVRESWPDTIRFVLTGKATLDNAIRAINEGGISRFFTKPCNIANLKVSIRQDLQKRELMVAARRLLKKVKHQSAVIQQLEKKYPNISKVARDQDGAIVIGEPADDYDELMGQIFRQLEEAGS